MEDKNFASGQVGSEAKYDVAFKEGKLCAELVYDGAVAEAGVVVKIKGAAVLDAIKAAIPGHFDDVLIDEAKELLLKA